jgi:hypothetical protein
LESGEVCIEEGIGKTGGEKGGITEEHIEEDKAEAAASEHSEKAEELVTTDDRGGKLLTTEDRGREERRRWERTIGNVRNRCRGVKSRWFVLEGH